MSYRNDAHRKGFMDRRNFLAAGLAGGAMATVPLAASAACNEVVVGTKQGRLRGRSVGNVFEFRGVRYAERQTAANRFKAPRCTRKRADGKPDSDPRWLVGVVVPRLHAEK